MRQGIFYAVLALAVWATLELFSWFGMGALASLRGIRYVPVNVTTISDDHRRILERLLQGTTTYTDYSATLGWTIKPGGAAPPLYRANAQGIRADREYSPHPTPGTVRVTAFGDSFTHGDGVGNADVWTEVLARSTPGLEILNFGVGGFGLDQALLRYRLEGRAYRPHLVLIGFMTENIKRSVNVYRPFYAPSTGQPLSKPRFVLREGQLSLLENPIGSLPGYQALMADPAPVLRRLGEHDYFYQHQPHSSRWDLLPSVRLVKLTLDQVQQQVEPIVRDGRYNIDAEAFAVTAATFDGFVAEVRADGARPLILIFPSRQDLQRHAHQSPRLHQPLLDHFDSRGFQYVDLLAAFEACGSGCLITALVPGHYSAAGNRMVAEYLAGYLEQQGLLKRESYPAAP